MATFNNAKVATGVMPRARLGVEAVYATQTLTAALANADVINFLKIPAGAYIMNIAIESSDLDTNGTPTLAWTLGDSSAANKFCAAGSACSIVGRTGGRENARSYFSPGPYAADDTLKLTVTTGPATGAASGLIKVSMLYTMQA